MPSFAYSANDASGMESTGVIDAADRAAALKLLRGKGLQPFKVAESTGGKAAAKMTAKAEAGAKSKGGKEAAAPSGPIKLNGAQVQLFTEELAELLEAGMRLEPALKLMEGRGDTAPHRLVSKRIGDLVREGHPFSLAVKMASPSFGELFAAVAAAGEAGGALSVSMRRQAAYMASVREMKGKVGVALIYPAFLLGSGVALVFLFVTFLLPRLTTLVSATRGSLPPLAKNMIAVSDFIKGNWWLLLIVIGALITGLVILARSPGGKPHWHRWKLKMPFIGNVLLTSFHTQFLETLASLSYGGLPLLRGLELASRVTDNVHAQAKLSSTVDLVKDGGALSRALEKTTLFPTNIVEMIRLGEHTGDLPASLRRAADRCGRELGKTLEKAAALVQPMIIVMMAGIVGVMAYLMITIIFDTMNQLRSF
jgi:general secretion pathway protein F